MEFNFDSRVLTDVTPVFKVGVLTDSQLSPFFWKKMNTFERNLRRACMRMAALKPDILIFAGDICNIGSKCAYKRWATTTTSRARRYPRCAGKSLQRAPHFRRFGTTRRADTALWGLLPTAGICSAATTR